MSREEVCYSNRQSNPLPVTGVMKLTSLKKIQVTVQDVAGAISAALGIEVEIVDEQLTIIAGSNRYKDLIGLKEEYGDLEGDFLYARTLRCGTANIVEDPGKDPRYDPSSLEGTTEELAEICCPIILNNKAVGAIGLQAITPEQRVNLLNNKQAVLSFLQHMSHLLAVKLSEEEVVERLKAMSMKLSTILETIHEGALAIDSGGVVTHCNSTAAKLLDTDPEKIIGHLLESVWPGAAALEVLKTGQEYTEKEEIYHTGHRRLHFIVSVRPIPGECAPSGAVISFRDIVQARRLIYHLSEDKLRYTFDDIIGRSQPLLRVKEQALRVAGGNSTVLITGESGTGKEVFARAIHSASPRETGPFVSVNCGAIPETLLESELFGYEGGAFTGARREGKVGKFEIADGGTIFLDEIGEMPLHLQVKLLHVLQDRVVERVGGNKKTPVDVRILAASNQDLERMMHEGKFRKDLYFRLSVIPLHIPPLRERKEDIPLFIEHCLEKYSRTIGKNIKQVSPEVTECLLHYYWYGNVRELENAIEYAVNMAAGVLITVQNLPPRIKEFMEERSRLTNQDLKDRLKDHERKILGEFLSRYGTSYQAKINIARELNISRATLYRKLDEYGLLKNENGNRES